MRRVVAAEYVTVRGFADAWPPMEEAEGDFAVRMNTLPKFVASRSLKEPLPWNGTLLKGDVADEVAKLKEEPGGDLLISGDLAFVATYSGISNVMKEWTSARNFAERADNS